MASGLSPHLRGHLLRFDPRPASTLEAAATNGLLMLAALLELVRLLAIAWLPASVPRLALPAPLLLLALFLLSRVGRPQPSLDWYGPRRWSEWSVAERSYLVQVVLIATGVFIALLGPGLRARLAEEGGIGFTSVFLAYLCYGFYQELVYRGMIQTALASRWGALSGVLVTNLLFTVGPLHWEHVRAPAATAVPMFGAIFTIGLLFGVIYQRSGNLWLVATMHAIGNAFIVSAAC